MAGNLCVEASAAVEGAGSSPPLVVLLRFCSEGDNTPDAIAVAQAVNDSLRLLPGGDGGEGSPGGKLCKTRTYECRLVWFGLRGNVVCFDLLQGLFNHEMLVVPLFWVFCGIRRLVSRPFSSPVPVVALFEFQERVVVSPRPVSPASFS